MPPPNVLIAGASRGIGLALAQEFAANGWNVHATHRGTGAPAELAAVPGVATYALEVTDPDNIAAFAAALGGTAIDLFIHNAGMGDTGHDLSNIDADAWLAEIRVNTIAPMMVAAGVLPNILAGNAKKMLFVSSDLGSIGGATTANHLVYRSSKAALNCCVRYLANAHAGDGVTAVAVHPGWVRTDMGGTGAPLSPAQSAANLRKLAEGLSPADNGTFLNHEGSELPW